MTTSSGPAAAGRQVPWPPLVTAFGATLAGVGGLLLAGLIGLGSVLVSLLFAGVGCVLVAGYRRDARLGWANAVTLARLVGSSWIAALTWCWIVAGPNGRSLAVMTVIAICCLALDGVDGHVARARGETSDFGARFDMETDAAMIMVLCIAVAVQGSVGGWVLSIGLARYVYWLCSFRVAALNRPVPPSLLRKTIAIGQSVAMLSCLVLGATGLGPNWLPPLVAVIALAALAWSFVSVIVRQLRAKP